LAILASWSVDQIAAINCMDFGYAWSPTTCYNETYCAIAGNDCDPHCIPFLSARTADYGAGTDTRIPATRSFTGRDIETREYEEALNLAESASVGDDLFRAPNPYYENEGCLFNDHRVDSQYERVFEDCNGNPIPADLEYYKAVPFFDHPTATPYPKVNSAFHWAEGAFNWWDAHAYCNHHLWGRGVNTTYLWCPGGNEENNWIYMSHPDQPVKQYEGSYGIWLGIFREKEDDPDSEYICGQNHTYCWYHQEYFKWRTSGAHPEPQMMNSFGTHWEDQIMMSSIVANWEDWPWDAILPVPGVLPKASAVCEMNCDLMYHDPYKRTPDSACLPSVCEDICYTYEDTGISECICQGNTQTIREDGETCKETGDDEVDIPAPDDDGPIPEIMHHCPDEITEEEVEQLLLHGCHCVKLGALTSFIELLGGLGKVEHINENCKNWHDARRCITLPGGACEGEILDGKTYKLAINHATARFSCHLNENSCLNAICEIDILWTGLLIKDIQEIRFGSGDFEAFVSNSTYCPSCDLCVPAQSCEGTAPDVRLIK